MNYIVLDIEATDHEINEMIEIGAVKVNEQLEIIDSYRSLIKPTNNPKLSWYIKKLTGIHQKEVDEAPTFPEVFEAFLQWGGEDVNFITWSNNDLDFIQTECNIHNIPCVIKQKFVNVQIAVSASLESANRLGLKHALTQLETSFEGTAHRAYDDAFNTAKLFIYAMKTFGSIETIKKQRLPKTATKSTEETTDKISLRQHSELLSCVNVLYSLRFKVLYKKNEEARKNLLNIQEKVEHIRQLALTNCENYKEVKKDVLIEHFSILNGVIDIVQSSSECNPKYNEQIKTTKKRIVKSLRRLLKQTV